MSQRKDKIRPQKDSDMRFYRRRNQNTPTGHNSCVDKQASMCVQ